MTQEIAKEQLKEILKAFCLDEENVSIHPFGSGHIHKTYSLYVGNRGFVLQNINTTAFKSPEKLMDNIAGVCEFLRNKIKATGGDPERQTRNVIYTGDGNSFYTTSDGSIYRMFTMIDDVHCYDSVDDPSLFYRCGEAFGLFQQQLSDYPAKELHDTIENFHNTPKRIENLEKAVAQNPLGKVAEVAQEIEFVLSRRELCRYITDRLADGRIPLRVTHNDTKLNNVLFDIHTDLPVCIIDLDTVMPGSLLYDFGDSIRFGASSAAEDEKDLSKVFVREDFYKAYLDGFLSKLANSITEEERNSLYYGAVIITLETGMRFLTDFILGDVYFNVTYPGQNLDRARTQFKLVKDLEEKKDILMQMSK